MDWNEWNNSDGHYIYYYGHESLRRSGVAILVNKRIQNTLLGYNLKWFQDKPFNITVIQVYVSTNNVEKAEVEWFYEDLQDLLELTTKKDALFIVGAWNTKVGGQETPVITGKFGLEVQNDAQQRLIELCQENTLVIANALSQLHKKRIYTWKSLDGQYQKQIDYVFAAKDGKALSV